MTAFIIAIAFSAGSAVAAILAIAWTVAVTMREADRGGWFNE